MIGDRKQSRLQRPLWRLGLSVGGAGILLVYLVVEHPRLVADTNLVPTSTPTVMALLPIPAAATATPVPSPTTTPAVRLYRIGETQHLDNIWVTPTHLQRLSDRGYMVNQGDEIVSIFLEIVNRSDQNYSTNQSHFVVLDSNGVQNPHLPYDPSRDRLREVTLIPGGHISGTITFEIPAGDDHLQLIYSPDIINPAKRKIWMLGRW